MDKEELQGVFRTATNNCRLVYASMVVFAHDDSPEFYRQLSSAMEIKHPWDDEYTYRLLKDPKVAKIAWPQLYDCVHRAALKELFEVTKLYCEATDQSDLLVTQSWYQFWRILRNSLSHDFRLQFREYDKKQLPIRWGTVKLDASMEGKDLTQGMLSREELVAFLEHVDDFIANKLS